MGKINGMKGKGMAVLSEALESPMKKLRAGRGGLFWSAEMAADAPARESPAKLAYTIDEFCEAVGISKSKIYAEIRAGRLKVKKVGTRTLVPVEEGRAWLKI